MSRFTSLVDVVKGVKFHVNLDHIVCLRMAPDSDRGIVHLTSGIEIAVARDELEALVRLLEESNR